MDSLCHLPHISSVNCIFMKALVPSDWCYAVLLMLYFKSCLVERAEEKALGTSIPRIWWGIFFCVL